MAIDGLGPSSLLAALQRLEGGRTERMRGTDRRRPAGPSQPDRAPSTHSDLHRVAIGLQAAGEAGMPRARQQTVGVLLQQEFGPEIREHPRYGELVDSIAQALADNPTADARLRTFLTSLSKG